MASQRTLSLLPPSTREMNVANAIRDYVMKMIDSVPGMKVLMMDHDTVRSRTHTSLVLDALTLGGSQAAIVGMVVSKTSISQKEVYLFELIEKENRYTRSNFITGSLVLVTSYRTLRRCASFVPRPSTSIYFRMNFASLPSTASTTSVRNCDSLSCTLHSRGAVFTNFLGDSDLLSLAKSDENNAVEQVQEFYADYFAVNNDTFSFNYPSFIYNNKVPLLRKIVTE